MTLVLLVINIALCFCCVRYMAKELNIVKLTVFSVSLFLFAYLLFSSIAFLFDIFSINGALIASALAVMTHLFWHRHVRRQQPASIDWNIHAYVIPLLLAVVALVLSGENFGYFGMGQDQGVYQVKAIELMENHNSRIYELPEYEALNTQEQREHYQQMALRLSGFDSLEQRQAEVLALRHLVDPEADITDVSENEVAAIFHGIPTYPAMLALTGRVAGMENMAWSQTLFYLLTLFVIWFAAEELGLSLLLRSFACLLFLLSPEVVWVSKSTLAEGFHALITAYFIYLLINRKAPEKRWLSSLMVLAFSLWHVSIYAMIPMFIVLYGLLYAKTHDGQYIRAGLISAISFMAGYTMMVIVAPRYSLANTYRLTSLFSENPGIIWPFFMVGGAAAVIVLLVIRQFDMRKLYERLFNLRTGSWLIRGLMAACLLLAVYHIVDKTVDGDVLLSMRESGLLNYAWMTGLVVLPALIIRIWHKPKLVLQDERTLGLSFMFFYSVLIYAVVLKPTIDYCYYYGRYFVPYIPLIGLAAAYFFRDFGRKALSALLVCALAVMIPFDCVLYLSKDDTFCSYDELLTVGNSLKQDNSAVVFSGRDTACLAFFPYRTLYNVDGYFMEDDVDEQLKWLSQRYTNVYLLHDTIDGALAQPSDTSVTACISHTNYIDDNASYRLSPCPFPIWFTKYQHTMTLYQYNVMRYCEYSYSDLDGKFLINGFDTEGRRHLQQNGVSFGPYISLPQGKYELTIDGENLTSVHAYVTKDNGTQKPAMEIIGQNEEQIALIFYLDEDSQNVEFCISNPHEANVVLDHITLANIGDAVHK